MYNVLTGSWFIEFFNFNFFLFRFQKCNVKNVKSCIIDSEAVAWDREKKQIQPFQVHTHSPITGHPITGHSLPDYPTLTPRLPDIILVCIFLVLGSLVISLDQGWQRCQVEAPNTLSLWQLLLQNVKVLLYVWSISLDLGERLLTKFELVILLYYCPQP